MLVFRNPGLIDLTAATTLGVNVKENENPIGQFGTGLKCAIAVVLRLGGQIEIWRGRKLHTFGLKEKTIRGKKFRIVTMNGRDLGFTDHYGGHWEAWMAYRELWSNCHDEGGEVVSVAEQPDVAPRMTQIVVRCREIDRAHDERHRIVLQTAPLVVVPGAEVHAGRSEHVYYRGIRVAPVPSKKTSLYTYCLTGHQSLTEDRTLAYQWTLSTSIARALVQCTNASVIADVLMADKNDWEFALPWRDVRDQKPSPQFMQTADALRGANKLTGSALDLFRSYLDSVPGYASPYLVTPSELQEACVQDALTLLEQAGVHIPRQTIQFKSDRGALGIRKENELTIVPAEYMSESALSLARNLLAHWSRAEQAGGLTLAHRILTGTWVPVEEIRGAAASRLAEPEDVF